MQVEVRGFRCNKAQIYPAGPCGVVDPLEDYLGTRDGISKPPYNVLLVKI